MSVSDVMKYVRETPGNTNPAVIKSMVEAEQREFQIPALERVLSEAKAYSDSKGGYTEPGRTLWQGKLADIGATTESSDRFTGASIVGKAFGLEEGKTYTVTLDGGTYTGVCKSALGGICLYVGNPVIFGIDDSGEPYCIAEADDSGTGDWISAVCDFKSGTYATVATPETIVPIDQKYLPSSIIDLKSYGIEMASWVFNGGGKYTIDDAGTFWTDIQKAKNTVYRVRSGDVFWDITPATQSDTEVNFRLVTTYGSSLFEAVASIVHEGVNGAVVYVIVNMQTLPT